MAKYLVTGFTPESGGDITATGILVESDISSVFSVWNIPFDHHSATPIRQQIESVLPDMVNVQIANYGRTDIVLTQSDIEYLI